MCYVLLNFCELLQLQSVPLLTSALLGRQRGALPRRLASAQPVWEKQSVFITHSSASYFSFLRCLLNERDVMRPKSPMTERLIRKAAAVHSMA